MRYHCFIYDEEERLDAGLRRLFAGFIADAAGEPPHAGATVRRDPLVEVPPAVPCVCRPVPAPRMW